MQRQYVSLHNLVDGCQTLNDVVFRFNQKYSGSGVYLFRGYSEAAGCVVLCKRGDEILPHASGIVELTGGGIRWINRLENALTVVGECEFQLLRKVENDQADAKEKQREERIRQNWEEYRQRKTMRRRSVSRMANRLKMQDVSLVR